MIRKIDHIGIAVKDIETHLVFYRDVLGLKFEGYEDLSDRGLRVAVFDVGGIRLELIQATSPDSTTSTFIERRGEGLHHIAFGVDDAEGTLAHLIENGIRALDPVPRPGAGGAKVAFLHPHDTGRVLMEICEEKPGDRRHE